MYDRIGSYNLDDVLPHIGRVEGMWYADKFIRIDSARYHVFAEKGVKCVNCGIEGSFFAVETHHHQNHNKWHLNLYAIDGDGNEVMMTKDHIIPASYGGKNHIDNLQPMCERCNGQKAAKCQLPRPMALEEYEAVRSLEADIRSLVSKLTHLRSRLPTCAHELKESARFAELARFQVRTILDTYIVP